MAVALLRPYILRCSLIFASGQNVLLYEISALNSATCDDIALGWSEAICKTGRVLSWYQIHCSIKRKHIVRNEIARSVRRSYTLARFSEQIASSYARKLLFYLLIMYVFIALSEGGQSAISRLSLCEYHKVYTTFSAQIGYCRRQCYDQDERIRLSKCD
ncbi:unnamed protein product [Albugo candida]|uniref:Uncharacterized protein n=1 Tax=Albugo candida TaxID=65357 RepID=A0A024FWR6_9STRA|nr:unnamed protein product [Albugo candida]|eukprot:CCI11367.1 unnamed protein product [Albugo candida]